MFMFIFIQVYIFIVCMYLCMWVYVCIIIFSFKFFTVHCIQYLILRSGYFYLKRRSNTIVWVANLCEYYSFCKNKIGSSPRVSEDTIHQRIYNSHQEIGRWH
jgi:hypothetical protein